MTVAAVASALIGSPAATPGLAVLAVLAWHQRPLITADVVAATGLSAAIVLPILARLEAGQVIERAKGEYRLSPSGRLIAEVIAG